MTTMASPTRPRRASEAMALDPKVVTIRGMPLNTIDKIIRERRDELNKLKADKVGVAAMVKKAVDTLPRHGSRRLSKERLDYSMTVLDEGEGDNWDEYEMPRHAP
ncbi:unnamed protein product [Chrysoparadoxa australica]